MTRQAVADLYGTVSSTVMKWCGRDRQCGTLVAKPMGGHRPRKLLDDRDWLLALLARLAEKPDLTLHALLAELRDRGTVVFFDALWRLLKREDITFKKTLFAVEQDRPDVVRRRNRWKRYQRRIDPTRLVFIDETWAKKNMTRMRGWQACGKPLVAKVPHGHWKTMTFVAALRHDRITAPLVLDGPINGDAFVAYVEQILAPTLAAGDVVVIDNLGSHKSRKVRQLIRAAGAHLLFLPPHSPDLNPIEQVFAKLKTLLRKAEERTVETVWKRIGTLLYHFKLTECGNYLRNSGYGSI
jgi:transposase